MPVRNPIANATAAGATPKDTWSTGLFRVLYFMHHWQFFFDIAKKSALEGGVVPYQICERVEFLAHERRLLPPTGYLAVEKVKKEAEGHEAKGQPEVGIVV